MDISILNIGDPNDILHAQGAFNNITIAEWENYITYAHNNNLFDFGTKKFLQEMRSKAGRAQRLSAKQVFKALSLIDRIEKAMSAQEETTEALSALKNNSFHPPIKHVTLRVAWHDSGWNGHICKDPKANRYCGGFHSLLSDRIRRQKQSNMASETAYRGQNVNDIDYIPPCFWSLNLFGSEEIKVKHNNPAAPNLDKIGEKLPANSIFTWPFGISFTHTGEEKERDGSYPANLETVRIPIFTEKIQQEKSIGFIYANYSNPFTEEEDTFLLIGCGMISDKGELRKFGPKKDIEAIRQSKLKMRHFPETNWALRISFDSPENMVSMPYHEYIEYCDRNHLSETQRDELYASIKVSITEPELVHCFKFVAMDIDDDEAIYLLYKMKQKLWNVRTAGIVSPEDLDYRIEKLNSLLEFCWRKRGHFPGFESLSRAALQSKEHNFPLAGLLDKLKDTHEDYSEKLQGLLNDPYGDPDYRKYAKYLDFLKEQLQSRHGISPLEFLKIAMLNLTELQFERILSGKIVDPEKPTRTLLEIAQNPYLLFEEYIANDTLPKNTGDITDGPIELFKIDIAYYPDINYTDKISFHRGFKYDDGRRIRALILQYLATLESTGDCFDEAEKIQQAISRYPLFYKRGTEFVLPPDFLLKLPEQDLLHLKEKLKIVIANDTRYFYQLWLYKYEKEIEQLFRTLLDEPDNTKTFPNLPDYVTESIRKLSAKLGQHLDKEGFREERTRLYENAFKKRLYVLAGNPGSGKSYELLNIIQELEKQGESYLLLAPTGKATLRLTNDKDFPGIECLTIDKLIADIEKGIRSKASVLNTNNIIIDEMSMVDLLKFQQLLPYLNYKAPGFKRLILVGDPDQLPPIGYGKILRDIIYFCKTHEKYRANVIELCTNCRLQLANSRLLELSGAFKYKGEFEESLIKLISSGAHEIAPGLRIRFWNDQPELDRQLEKEFEQLCIKYKLRGNTTEKLNQLLGLKIDGQPDPKKPPHLECFQIMTPYKSSFYGTGAVNEFVQDKFKSGIPYDIMNDWYKQSDKIIRTKNYYDNEELLISNGSIGFIRGERGGLLYFPEDNYEPFKLNTMRKGERENFELAFAITIHKSQGSGFDHTFVILPNKFSLLSRELIYTALTRAKQSVTLFIQGDCSTAFEKSLLGKARRRSFTEFRKTTLMLGDPFRYYTLEAEPGVFVESRIELMIYNSLLQTRQKLGADKFQFSYESMPEVDGKIVPIKTDFTIFYNGKTYYWEHLGLLGERTYERKWREFKYPTYEKFGLLSQLITTDELNGINPQKIDEVIDRVLSDNFSSAPPSRYSKHHYPLR